MSAQAKKCPVCGRKCDPVFAPFCSRRCADVDLNRWFSQAYTVQTEEEPESDENP